MIFADGLHIVATPSHSFENCCKALDERLNLGRISFRNIILLVHPRLPRAQFRPNVNIGQV